MKNILITGGGGFIGSNLALMLQEENNVFVIDDFSFGSMDNLKDFKGVVYKESILNFGELNMIVVTNKINEIYHLASASASPMFYESPIHSSKVNLIGTLNILEVAKLNKVRKVVYATTSSLYGNCEMPFTEDKFGITTFYPLTKYVNELYAKLYTKEGWIETTGCRFFSVYGKNEGHKGKYANFLTQFIWNMLENKSPTVYDDGKQTRDFTHVSDICRGLIASMECKEANGKVINLGTGEETNILDMIAIINKFLGKEIKPTYLDNPIKGYVKYTKSDTTLMRDLLKFEPNIKLEDGIKLTIDAYNTNI